LDSAEMTMPSVSSDLLIIAPCTPKRTHALESGFTAVVR
jgi:hypothetical protein